jgi:hypothetical protein
VNLFGPERFDPEEYWGQEIGLLDYLASGRLPEREKAAPAGPGRRRETPDTSTLQPPRRSGNNGYKNGV